MPAGAALHATQLFAGALQVYILLAEAESKHRLSTARPEKGRTCDRRYPVIAQQRTRPIHRLGASNV